MISPKHTCLVLVFPPYWGLRVRCPFFSVFLMDLEKSLNVRYMQDYPIYKDGCERAWLGEYMPQHGFYYPPLFAFLFTPFLAGEIFWALALSIVYVMALYQSKSFWWGFRIAFAWTNLMWAYNGNADPFISWAMAWAWSSPKHRWAGVVVGLCCFKPSFVWGVAIFTLWHYKDLDYRYYLGLFVMAGLWWAPLFVWLLIHNGGLQFITELMSVESSIGLKYYSGTQYGWWWLWLYSFHGKIDIYTEKGKMVKRLVF